LLFIAITELAMDYEKIFSAVTNKPKVALYRATGIVDKMFLIESPAKYSNIVQQNIFNLDGYKKGIVKITENARLVSNDFVFDVRGVTITPENKYALLWDKNEKISIIANEGENVKKWKIVSIFKDRIIIGIDGDGAYKEIYVNKNNEN